MIHNQSSANMVTVKLLVSLLLVPSILILSFNGDNMVYAGAPSRGSCRVARKCCDGKDPNCVVQNGNKNAASLNSILQGDGNDIDDIDLDDLMPCYCDHGCMSVGDCCSDFKDYCGGKSSNYFLTYSF